MSEITVEVVGLPDLLKKLDARLGAPAAAGAFLDKWRFAVERGAKANAPVWRGGLRRSITSERDRGRFPAWARAGTNLFYAPFVHDGTRPHFPPIAAIAPWARSKGLSPFLVARSISLHGTKARPFLADAAKDAGRHVPRWIDEFASEIERNAAGGTHGTR